LVLLVIVRLLCRSAWREALRFSALPRLVVWCESQVRKWVSDNRFQLGLENRSHPPYSSIMDAIIDKTLPGWLAESLERSDAQIAAGQVVPIEPVLDRLRASVSRMRGKRPQAEPRTAHKA
jgi:hypothetical protein